MNNRLPVRVSWRSESSGVARWSLIREPPAGGLGCGASRNRRFGEIGAERLILSAAAACGGRCRRQRAAFGEDLHVLERLHEPRGSLLLVSFASGVVSQHRIIEYQSVNEF